MTTKTTPSIRYFDRLKMLRNDLAIHNLHSDNVKVLDWALHVIEKAGKASDQLEYLKGCFNDRI